MPDRALAAGGQKKETKRWRGMHNTLVILTASPHSSNGDP